jgi:electron-transferring-flavoprotein dehydrogenase
MVRWMAGEIERREVPGVDVMLLPGFAGTSVLWEDGRVVGVQTADRGVNADGSPRATFEPGNRLRAKVTVFGEGPRGHLMRELDEVLGLQAQALNPQLYESGAKEIWELPAGRVPDGFVLHSTGWPQSAGESGGSFIYKMGGNLLAVGYVVSLDTRDPFVDAHLALQQFKTHPRIRPMLEGGKMVQYGAKAMAISGKFSMPRQAFPGGMLVGDAAQMTNAARFKGIHLGMKSGMCAADAIAKALAEDDFSETSLERYPQELMASWAGRELHRTRNFHQIMAHGFNISAAVKLGISLCTGGWQPGELSPTSEDAARAVTTQAYYGRPTRREDLDPGIKFDGEPCITKLDDVYASGVMHDEHQPGHLKIVKGDQVCVQCWNTKGSPCTAFCPAQVYEMHPDADGQVEKLAIAYSNCLHCKTCEIKCPEGNVVWTPPEGGGGPGYKFC